MIDAYAIEDVRRAEAATMQNVPDGELMRRAAAGLAEIVAARLEELGGDRVVVLAGPGDNGGDALYAAAALSQSGANTAVVQVDPRVHEAAMGAAEAAGVIRLRWSEGEPDEGVRGALGEADVVLDGITGIGGRPGLATHLARIQELFDDDAYVMAVDLPSGADPSGLTGSTAIFADETVTFSLAKPVHLLPATEPACGLLTVVDIGVQPVGRPVAQRLTYDDAAALWPVPTPYSDKYSRGVLGLVAGSEQYTGAPVLAATAAVTAGVGMVRYVGPERAENVLRSTVPEVVFGDGRVQAWAIGSGWSLQDSDPEQLRAAKDALASNLPVLLDAGGLDLLDEPRSAPTLLTPHFGELIRLAKRLGLDVEGAEPAHGVAIAQQVADKLGATVLVKGSVTAVVSPSDSGHPIRTQANAPAWAGTAGSGDTLSGIAGTLLAAGREPHDAGPLAALVHGVSAELANPGGPVRARSIADHVGAAVRNVLQNAVAGAGAEQWDTDR